MSGLLPCPFCGLSAMAEHRANGWIARCVSRFEDCPINGRTHHFVTRAEAIAAWNTRAPRAADQNGYGKEPCPCGHRSCDKWFLTGIGNFVQGSGFTEDEANLILASLTPASLALDSATMGDGEGVANG